LTTEQVQKNRDTYGENVISPRKQKSEIMKFLTSMLMGLNLLLWISGVISVITYLIQLATISVDDDIEDDNVRKKMGYYYFRFSLSEIYIKHGHDS